MNGTYAARTQHRRTRSTTAGGLARTIHHQRLSALEMVTLVAIAVLLIAGALSARPRISTGAAGQAVQVQAGETLWSIAQAHPTAGLTTAQTAGQISRSNQLASSTLHAGQTLTVPARPQSMPQTASH